MKQDGQDNRNEILELTTCLDVIRTQLSQTYLEFCDCDDSIILLFLWFLEIWIGSNLANK